MLTTKLFTFNRRGQLTIFAETISFSNLQKIIKLCVLHARRKKIRKPCSFRMVPTLA